VLLLSFGSLDQCALRLTQSRIETILLNAMLIMKSLHQRRSAVIVYIPQTGNYSGHTSSEESLR